MLLVYVLAGPLLCVAAKLYIENLRKVNAIAYTYVRQRILSLGKIDSVKICYAKDFHRIVLIKP